MFSLCKISHSGLRAPRTALGALCGALLLASSALASSAVASPMLDVSGEAMTFHPPTSPRLDELTPRYLAPAPSLVEVAEPNTDAGVDVVPLPASIGGAGVVLAALLVRRAVKRRHAA